MKTSTPATPHLSPSTTLPPLLAALVVMNLTNTGNAGEVRKSEAGGLEAPVRIAIKELPKLEGPEVADFDGDGKKDLLSADYSGHLFLRTNVGTAKKPEFSSPRKLKAGTDVIKIKHW